MASEAVKVIVRCRPLNQREKDLKCKVILSMESSCGQCSIINPNDGTAPPKTFIFDGAYFIPSTTEQIYNEIVYPLVESVTEGYNGTVFAYGQTGCGKSFTMQGIPNPSTQKGIIPRSFEHIFEAIATSDSSKFLVHASYLEIYNEEIRDLLGEDSKKKLDLKEHPDKGVYVPGLSLHPVHNVHECETVMEHGWKNRSVGATLMNADSSRSHSIFTIHLEILNTDNASDEHIRKGKLNLVDLAGSERQAKTGATGDRLKEATKINLSLSALGNVISALVDGKSKHIPYRDSKLTRLLQDSLGGNTKTLMVACLSPADNNYDETLSTLRYANRAKNIQNKPKINEDPKDALLREYQEEIIRLKELLSGKIPGESTEIPITKKNVEENEDKSNVEKIRKEYDGKMQDLMFKYQQEQESKAQLQLDVNNLKAYYEAKLAQINGQNPVVETVETIDQEDGIEEISTTVTQNGHIDAAQLPSDIKTLKNQTIEEIQVQALERLQELQEQMVGGEKANDKALKDKRAKRKHLAEKRIRALAALAKGEDDDGAMLQVYDDIHEELKAKSSLIKKAKKKIQALEREICDLQSEFETDRTDYLESIRKQEQQIKLLQQILDKVQPTLRRDCNYSNLDVIKKEAVWDEDQQKWRLPELLVAHTRLPPTGIQPGGRAPSHSGHSSTKYSSYFDDSPEDKFFQKLKRSEQEDIAGNYFKTKRQEQLLSKFQDVAHRAMPSRQPASLPSSTNMASIETNTSLFQLSMNSNGTPSSLINSASVGQESSVRKPTRLEALPAGSDTNRKVKKNTRLNLGSLEWPI